MTIMLPVSTRSVSATATAGQTAFPAPFPVLAACDLTVTRVRAGARSELALSADYAVTGVGQQSGAQVVLTTGALDGDVYLIEGALAPQRQTSIPGNGPIPSDALNADATTLMILLQELRRDVDRCLRRMGDDPDEAKGALPSGLAGHVLGFDENGNPVAVTMSSSGDGGDPTDLGVSATADSVTVSSSTGADATIPSATGSAAGVLNAARAAKIDSLATVAASGSYNDLTDKPNLATVATTGSYNDLTDKPSGLSAMTGATEGADGTGGSVPAPLAGQQTYVLLGNAAWTSLPSALSGANLDQVGRLGIGTTDTGNVLSVSGASSLFSNGSGSVRVTLSKSAAGETASFVFQDNWSGRAEFGLCGDDAFTMKVSDDGSSWHNGIVIAASSGAVTFPNTIRLSSNSLLAAPIAGTQEYDGNAPYFSPADGVRGVVHAYQYSKVTASGGVSLNDDTNAQSYLPSGSQAFPVQTGVYYRFRTKLLLNLGTTNSRNKQFLFSTAGAFSWIAYTTHTQESSAQAGGGNADFQFHNVATAESYGADSTSQYVYTTIEGEFVMSSAGTITPQIQFTAAPGGTNTNMRGSYFELTAFGPSASSTGLT